MEKTLIGLVVTVLILSISACGGRETAEMVAPTVVEDEVRSGLAELANGGGDPTRELAGLVVAVLRGGEKSFEATFGRSYIDPSGEADRVLTPDSLMRVASIS
ncbi:MAG: hypothetical protein JSV80_00875, partial [Acidobacteriota bacterium]